MSRKYLMLVCNEEIKYLSQIKIAIIMYLVCDDDMTATRNIGIIKIAK